MPVPSSSISSSPSACPQGLAQVGNVSKKGLDLLPARLLGSSRFKAGDLGRDGVGLSAQILYAPGWRPSRPDVFAVLVLLQAQRLAIEGLLHFLALVAEIGEAGITLLPRAVGSRIRQLAAEQLQALSPNSRSDMNPRRASSRR